MVFSVRMEPRTHGPYRDEPGWPGVNTLINAPNGGLVQPNPRQSASPPPIEKVLALFQR
jgi:hypothetical protein